jgi:undecaprenyl-diphosphatase
MMGFYNTEIARQPDSSPPPPLEACLHPPFHQSLGANQPFMDQSLFIALNNSPKNPIVDVVMATLSSWAAWWPLVVIAGACLLVFGGFRARALVFSAVLAIGINDGLVCRTLKSTVQRPRPNEVLSGVRSIDLAKATPRVMAVLLPLKTKTSSIETPATTGKSFPSSHAANTFAMATVCFLFYRRWGWIAFLPAALVAFSRMYVGSHWPLDVLAGSFIGIACALGVVTLLRFLWKKFAPVFAPQLHSAHHDLLNP